MGGGTKLAWHWTGKSQIRDCGTGCRRLPQFTGRVHCSNYELQPGRTGTVLLLRLVQCFMQVGARVHYRESEKKGEENDSEIYRIKAERQ